MSLRAILLFVAACQTSSGPNDNDGKREPAQQPPRAQGNAIEVHELAGGVTARVTPGHPCRVSIDSTEMQIGGEPLVAVVGAVRWTGDDRGNGITLLRDTEVAARIVETDGGLSLIDPQGVPMVRVVTDGDDVKIIDRQSAVVRHVTRSGKGLEVQPGPTVTGTDDRLLVAALTAVEAPVEIRALAACHRLFGLEKK